MLHTLNLTEEIRDLEIHFTERLDDGADSKELSSILEQIKSLKRNLNSKTHTQLTATATITCPI